MDSDFTSQFKDIKELREYARQQFLTLVNANKRVDVLENENRRLREENRHLNAARKERSVELIARSPEQELCEIEIAKLREISFQRPLSLEEVKIMDLLVKNLYLAKGKPDGKDIESKAGKANEISADELVALALVPSGK